ncbi:ABC transporter permease [Rhodobacteraceae bacterium CCMM004]|nr:ABC transporter permease [Rhodobacteraceae bacterium CCMM004]
MTPDLTPFDIAAASALLFLGAGLSLVLSLHVGRGLLVAGARMVVQLVVLATLLGLIFAAANVWVTLGAMAAMAVFAGFEVLARQDAPAGRRWTVAVGAGVMIGAGWVVVLPALALLIEARPWYAPQVALPVFGMVAGSSMTGIALALDTFSTAIRRDVRIVEARLLAGHTRGEALSDPVRQAIRTGLMPTINAMSAIGLVTIPGMMTGQILAGADVMQAAKYQMVLMFLIAGTSVLGVVGAVHAMARRMTDHRHRLRLDRLRTGE